MYVNFRVRVSHGNYRVCISNVLITVYVKKRVNCRVYRRSVNYPVYVSDVLIIIHVHQMS